MKTTKIKKTLKKALVKFKKKSSPKIRKDFSKEIDTRDLCG